MVCLSGLVVQGHGVFPSATIDNNARRSGQQSQSPGFKRGLPHVFEATTAQALPVRILISLVVVMPAGFLMGFAFPTGMLLVENVDREPTPWFWGINGATGVLASVLAVVIGMSFGINVIMLLAGLCYLALIPTASALLAMSPIGSRSA